jgi:hypothetical protein
MVAAIAGSRGTGGVLDTGGVDRAIVAATNGSSGGGIPGADGVWTALVAFVEESTSGGGVSVATVTSPPMAGRAPPQSPQKRCEAVTAPQCGHVICGILATPWDTAASLWA